MKTAQGLAYKRIGGSGGKQVIEFKDRLNELMNANGMSNAKLAKISGLAYNSISLYRVGKVEPGLFALITLADTFNVTLDYLSGWDEEIKRRYGFGKVRKK